MQHKDDVKNRDQTHFRFDLPKEYARRVLHVCASVYIVRVNLFLCIMLPHFHCRRDERVLPLCLSVGRSVGLYVSQHRNSNTAGIIVEASVANFFEAGRRARIDRREIHLFHRIRPFFALVIFRMSRCRLAARTIPRGVARRLFAGTVPPRCC